MEDTIKKGDPSHAQGSREGGDRNLKENHGIENKH